MDNGVCIAAPSNARGSANMKIKKFTFCGHITHITHQKPCPYQDLWLRKNKSISYMSQKAEIFI